jgi:predicted nucleotidyltransferase
MKINYELVKRKGEIKALCLSHKVKHLYFFVAEVTGKVDEIISDFDFVVEIHEKDPVERKITLLSLSDQLESLFQRKIELLTDSAIKNLSLRKSINASKVLIYDGLSEKMLF